MPEFLTREDVREIHALQLQRFGGAAGIRDSNLLESALAQPEAGFGEQYIHEDLFAMAAAYLFHIVCNHPFVDGNKRTGLISALVFLEINGIAANQGLTDFYDITIAVANGRMKKDELAAALRKLLET